MSQGLLLRCLPSLSVASRLSPWAFWVQYTVRQVGLDKRHGVVSRQCFCNKIVNKSSDCVEVFVGKIEIGKGIRTVTLLLSSSSNPVSNSVSEGSSEGHGRALSCVSSSQVGAESLCCSCSSCVLWGVATSGLSAGPTAWHLG